MTLPFPATNFGDKSGLVRSAHVKFCIPPSKISQLVPRRVTYKSDKFNPVESSKESVILSPDREYDEIVGRFYGEN